MTPVDASLICNIHTAPHVGGEVFFPIRVSVPQSVEYYLCLRGAKTIQFACRTESLLSLYSLSYSTALVPNAGSNHVY